MDGTGRGCAVDFAGRFHVPAHRQPADGNRGGVRPDCGDYGRTRYSELYQAGEIYRLCVLCVADFRCSQRDVRLYAPALPRCRKMDTVPAIPYLVHGPLHLPAEPWIHNPYGRTEVLLLFLAGGEHRGVNPGFYDVL